MKARAAPKSTALGRALVDSLQQTVDAMEAGEKLTVRRIACIPAPEPFDAEKIRHLRESFGVSQAVLAKLIGASTKTVQGWEQGNRVPGIACRLLERMEKHPEHWKELLTPA